METAELLQSGDNSCEGHLRDSEEGQGHRGHRPPFWSLSSEQPAPRWIVVAGVIIYCVVAWVAVFHVGGATTDWLLAVLDGSTAHAEAPGR
jgi:hypothetical protein